METRIILQNRLQDVQKRMEDLRNLHGPVVELNELTTKM